jgi:hypothetical protein
VAGLVGRDADVLAGGRRLGALVTLAPAQAACQARNAADPDAGADPIVDGQVLEAALEFLAPFRTAAQTKLSAE